MTREELLYQIEEEASYQKLIDVLRAVMELHRPEEQDHKQYEKCWNCNLLYPCPTIQAIKKELM